MEAHLSCWCNTGKMMAGLDLLGQEGPVENVVIQVKSGHVDVRHIRELRHVISNLYIIISL